MSRTRKNLVDNLTLTGSIQESVVSQSYGSDFAFNIKFVGSSLELKMLTSVNGVDFQENTTVQQSFSADENKEIRIFNIVRGEVFKFEFVGIGVLTIDLLV